MGDHVALKHIPVPCGTDLPPSQDSRSRTEETQKALRGKYLYAALSHANRAIIRIHEPQALFDAICRAAIEYGKFSVAWIGLLEQTTGWVQPVAVQSSASFAHIDLRVSIDPHSAKGEDFAGTVLREGRRYIVNDFFADERTAPWMEHARGIKSWAAFPLNQHGRCVGALNLYGDEIDFFTDDVVAVLEEMATNLSFALENAEREGERVATEQSLRESEARFRELNELSVDWYWEQDENFCFTMLCGGRLEESGFEPGQFLGKPRWDQPGILLSQEAWAAHKAVLEAHGRFRDFTYRRIGADGVTRHLSVSGRPVFDGQGAFKGYRGIGRDVTEQVQAEQALRESEGRFRALTELSSDWYWEQDERFRFTLVSGGEAAKTGRAGSESLGKVRWELGDIALSEEQWAAHRAVLEAHEAFRDFTFKRVRPDRSVYVSISGQPIFDAQGTFTGYRGVAKDITDRVLADEEQRRLVKRLEEANHQLLQAEKLASLGQLAAGVAHEINNPIGFVNSNVGTLGTYIQGLLRLVEAYEQAEAAISACPEQWSRLTSLKEEIDFHFVKQDVSDLIAQSKDGLDRVKRIVQDLKDFSRAGEARLEWTDLHACLDSTLNVVANEIKYKAEVVKQYGAIPLVQCVASQVNQVLMNLLVNAAQAIPERGQITISTTSKNDYVCISIVDTGGGIAPEHLGRIFDPFFTTKPVGKGTGLGLSVSYSIVAKHRGRIEVVSRVGAGTTFDVWLPIAAAEDLALDSSSR